MDSNSKSSPAVPQGWQASWSDQYNQWFYVDEKTGTSQWEHPSSLPFVPPPTTNPNPQQIYNDPTQPQHPQHSCTPPPTATHPDAPTDRGIMARLGSFDPKTQTALAVGSSLAAGAYLEHEYAEHHHHTQHNQILGSMANLIGVAGVGALGAKFFGRKAPAVQSQPQPQAAPYQPAPQQFYQTSPPAGPGYSYSAPPPLYPTSSNPPFIPQNNNPPTLGPPPPFIPQTQTHASAQPRLYIHAATFADADVTDRVRRLITQTQDLRIAKMADEFGDPWPEAKRKAFCVLYQYGERPLEVWCGSTTDGNVDIRNEALSNTRMAFVNKEPGRIVCLIWGQISVLSKERTEKLEKDGELDCKDLGDGGFYPWEIRNLICFYRTEDGSVGIGHGREGGTMRLPWNPLAKWS